MSWSTALYLLLMLTVANGAPIVAAVLCAGRCAWSVDDVIGMANGRVTRPLVFGGHKTVRGMAAAIVAAVAAGYGYGWPVWIGLLAGAAAMLGDLGSSFIKRRMNIPPGGSVLGIDQVPESLLPSLAVAIPLRLTLLDVAAVVGGFVVIELLLTRCWSYLTRDSATH